MKRKFVCIILIILNLIFMTSCGVFDKEYVVVEDYQSTTEGESSSNDIVQVTNIQELRSSIRSFIYQGNNDVKLIFAENYKGDIESDLRAVIWQFKTQDALCAYCVENIKYELNEIVSYYEANIEILYSSSSVGVKDIVQLSYSAGLDEIILSAYEKGQKNLAILIGTSSYTDKDLEELFFNTYYSDPISCPVHPIATVNSYSGNNMQRLYEISIDYELTDSKLKNERYQLTTILPFDGLTVDKYSDIEKLDLISEYLSNNCKYDKYADDSIYSALVLKKASSKGISLAIKALCDQLGLESYVVVGQKDRYEYYWNIVNIDNHYYHLDYCSHFLPDVKDQLYNDVQMWGVYRWDTFNYPACDGEGIID